MERGLKRGQGAAGAAVLVAIILGLLITFIILIPPSERAELLGDEKASNVTGRGTLGQAEAKENLLTLTPGKIDFLGQLNIEHPLPVVNIYTSTESKILAEKNVALAKRGIFSEETDIFSFSIPDYENTEDALLSFNVENVKGRLIISLNGEKIYNSDLTTESVQPVRLPKNLLKEKNEMVFRVSSPGLAFWVTNSIALSDIQIVGDVTSLEAQSSTNIFLISETEKRNLDRVVLKFQPDCVQDETAHDYVTALADYYTALNNAAAWYDPQVTWDDFNAYIDAIAPLNPGIDMSVVKTQAHAIFDTVANGSTNISFRTAAGTVLDTIILNTWRIKDPSIAIGQWY